jgi:excisionase family DNA binding protein
MSDERDILNIDEAAELLGVSVKTFNKVLHAENIPARKIGREWKFSRAALIAWVGGGRSQDFYDGTNGQLDAQPEVQNGAEREHVLAPAEKARARRTAGWHIDLD